MPKFIAITQRLYEMQGYHEVREALSTDWGEFFATHLGEYYMLPLSYKQDFARYLPHLAGVILSGGNDLSICNDSTLNRERDNYESALIQSCIQHNIALLGICRGAQMIGHYFGAEIKPCTAHVGLHEICQLDNPLNPCCFEWAQQTSPKDSQLHSKATNIHNKDLQIHTHIKRPNLNQDSQKNIHESTCPNCGGYESYRTRFLTNSFHNYGMTTLGNELAMLAHCGDEGQETFSIEAFAHKRHKIFGIMWHIERAEGMNNSAIFELWRSMLPYS